MMHIADDQNALLDYLYEEGDADGRVAIAKHLQECTRCSVAVLEFQTVRGMLSEWTPPSAQLGFRVVQDGSNSSPAAGVEQPARDGRSWGRGPGLWAQAVAAALLFAAGMAVSSQFDVEYQEGALTVRGRSAVPVRAARNASIELPASQDYAVARRDEQIAPNAAGTADGRGGNNVPSDELLRRVRAMIEQSELRQQRELALRLSQVAREVDTQHRADLLRIQQNLGQIEMDTGAQIDQQRQLMDYLVRTSGGAK